MTERVDELVSHLKSLSDEELRELAGTSEWAYFIHRVYKLRPADELTLERVEWDAQICRQYPCSTEFYEAQVELNRQRFQYSVSPA
jgi:hypothetical protein